MPSYIGVEQSALLKSLEQGLSLLEAYSIGDECQAYIDEIRGVNATQGASPLEKIKNAKTDLELVQAVGSSKTSYLFLRLYDVMEYHLINDTDGIGKETVENLAKWGGLEGAQTMEYNALDKESQSWLLSQYVQRIINKKASIPLSQRFSMMAAQILDKGTRQDLSLGNKLFKASVENFKKDTTGQGLSTYFEGLSLSDRHKLMMVAQIKSGMAVTEKKVSGALSRYGVVIDDLSNGNINWGDPAVEKTREKLEQILRPFFPLAEVDMIGVGLILRDNSKKGAPQGVVFNCSKRAAETVAKEMKGYQVIDHQGKAVALKQGQNNVTDPKPPSM